MTDTRHGSVNWMLDELVAKVGADWAVALSTDGIVLQKSARIDRDDADPLAAMASSLLGVTQGAARHFQRGAVELTVVEMETGVLVVTAAGPNALLAVMAGKSADLGAVGYEMNRLAERVNQHLATDQRTHATPRP